MPPDVQALKDSPAFHGTQGVHYIHRSSPPVPILSQTNPVHITPSHLSKILPNIIHPPTSWPFPLAFPLIIYTRSSSLPFVTLPTHLILLDFIILTLSKQLHYRPNAHKGNFCNTVTIWPQNICWQCHLNMKKLFKFQERIKININN
jgi:hypothetical protein